MTLEQLNQLDQDGALAAFLLCCSANRWAQAMTQARPFGSVEDVLLAADSHWQDLTEKDYLAAFDGHPKIGDIDSLKAKYADTKALAGGEQSGAANADERVLQQLAQANEAYLSKFGFIFIVCATGKSAEQMLDLLLERLDNEREQELINAAEQQRQIFHIRLKKLLS